jgi:hypothetical protein
MKKSLIALAALAAFGTASAQSTATISGKFGVAYSKALGSVGNIGVSDGDVNFAAVEDLGGGLKAGATIGLRTRGRESVVGSANAGGSNTDAAGYSAQEVGRDATVFLSGAFGTVTAGSIELGNGITGNGWAGTTVTLPKDLNNGGVLSANAYGNLLQYTSPAIIPGLNLTLLRVDSIGAVGVTNTRTSGSTVAGNVLSVNYDEGTAANLIGATYVNGPLTAGADFAKFSNKTATTALIDRDRIRVSAAYDLGVVKVGFGMEDNRGKAYSSAYIAGTNYDGRQTTAGISAPIGNLRVGLVYTRNTEAAVVVGAAAKGDEVAKAIGFGADYSFSKRTVLNYSQAKITRTGGDTWSTAAGTARSAAGTSEAHALNSGTQYRVRLMHSF